MVGNFRVTGAQTPGDFQHRSLPINCVDSDLRANPSRVIHEQPRNIPRTCGKIETRIFAPGVIQRRMKVETRR